MTFSNFRALCKSMHDFSCLVEITMGTTTPTKWTAWKRSSMSQLSSIHHDFRVKMHTSRAYGYWSVSVHNDGKESEVLWGRYGTMWLYNTYPLYMSVNHHGVKIEHWQWNTVNEMNSNKDILPESRWIIHVSLVTEVTFIHVILESACTNELDWQSPTRRPAYHPNRCNTLLWKWRRHIRTLYTWIRVSMCNESWYNLFCQSWSLFEAKTYEHKNNILDVP